MSKKIYISPERRPAPHGPYAVGGVYEHDVCNEIATLEKVALERCGFEVVIAPRDATLEQRVAWANANKIDYYQPLHSNAGGGTGAECLYYDHPASIKANQLVYDELVKLYPSKRGCKDYTQFYENNSTNMVSCYPEIAFHDNPADARFILDNKQHIAEAIAKGVCAYFDVAYVPAPTSTPTPTPEPTNTIQCPEVKRLQDENEKLRKDAADLSTRVSELEAKLRQINQLSA